MLWKKFLFRLKKKKNLNDFDKKKKNLTEI